MCQSRYYVVSSPLKHWGKSGLSVRKWQSGVGTCQSMASRCGLQAGGECVWQRLQLDHDEEMVRVRGTANHHEVRVDGFLVPLQKGCRFHQGSCGSQRNH